MNDTQRLYNGLTRDSWKNALAETQGHSYRAIANDDKQMIDIWNNEVARIQSVLDNWEILSVEML